MGIKIRTVAAGVLALGIGTAGAAGATARTSAESTGATNSGSWSYNRSYSQSSTKWHKVDSTLCLRVQSSQRVTVRFTYYDHKIGADEMTFTHPRISYPKATVNTYRTCSTSSPRTVSKLRITHRYATASSTYCTVTPSLNASFPWGLGVSITPSCGERKNARQLAYPTHGRESKYSDSTDAVIATWPKLGGSMTSSKRRNWCYQATVDVYVVRGTSGKSVPRITTGSQCRDMWYLGTN